MENFERRLLNLKIPVCSNDPLEEKLRSQLITYYFSTDRQYRIKYRLAAGFACLLIVFITSTIISPSITYKLNSLVFNKEIIEKVADTRVNGESSVDYTEALEEYNRYVNNMKSTSINNPNLINKLDPGDYQEDKTYLIRKYVSQKEGSLMIVSEFDKDTKKSARKISY